jgi:hypothetical protein
MPIQADHEHMVKFTDEDDGYYKNVRGKIKILRKRATDGS